MCVSTGRCLKRSRLSSHSRDQTPNHATEDELVKLSRGNSRSVSSNQTGVHPDLASTLTRHQNTIYQKPIADYAQIILDQIEQQRQAIGGRLILDSACGTGASSITLAEQFPHDLIVGIDQSEYRLNKQTIKKNNLLFFRADLIDIWLLMSQQDWKIDQHYLLYPNPWPKKKHLKRRWHGHPVFPDILKISQQIEARSNWKTYLDELALAVELMTGDRCPVEVITPTEPLTLFEKKYSESGQVVFSYRWVRES